MRLSAPPVDVATVPELQPMLLRLGRAVGDINASYINRIAYVKQVAGAIVAARLRK